MRGEKERERKEENQAEEALGYSLAREVNEKWADVTLSLLDQGQPQAL